MANSFNSPPADNWQPGFESIGLALHEATFVVVDLETTGASPKDGSGITEIGAIKIRGGEVISEYSTFLDPGIPLPQYITELTGITDQMLFGAPTIDAIFPEFLDFVGSTSESILVAHNSPFDIGFLKSAATSIKHPWPGYEVIDTVRLARLVIERNEVLNYKLSTLSEFFQTPTAPTHRALDDARTTVDVLHRLIERLGGFEVFTIQDLQQFMKRLPEKKPTIYP
jgi:hypothetical protein